MDERTAAALINCMLPLVRSNRELQVLFTCDCNLFYTVLKTSPCVQATFNISSSQNTLN
jgi:hypothetical protein